MRLCAQLDEAVTLSQSVVSRGQEAGEFLPRAYLALGLCYSLKASEGKAHGSGRRTFQIISNPGNIWQQRGGWVPVAPGNRSGPDSC